MIVTYLFCTEQDVIFLLQVTHRYTSNDSISAIWECMFHARLNDVIVLFFSLFFFACALSCALSCFTAFSSSSGWLAGRKFGHPQPTPIFFCFFSLLPRRSFSDFRYSRFLATASTLWSLVRRSFLNLFTKNLCHMNWKRGVYIAIYRFFQIEGTRWTTIGQFIVFTSALAIEVSFKYNFVTMCSLFCDKL